MTNRFPLLMSTALGIGILFAAFMPSLYANGTMPAIGWIDGNCFAVTESGIPSKTCRKGYLSTKSNRLSLLVSGSV